MTSRGAHGSEMKGAAPVVYLVHFFSDACTLIFSYSDSIIHNFFFFLKDLDERTSLHISPGDLLRPDLSDYIRHDGTGHPWHMGICSIPAGSLQG